MQNSPNPDINDQLKQLTETLERGLDAIQADLQRLLSRHTEETDR